jgi:hypothetical protein
MANPIWSVENQAWVDVRIGQSADTVEPPPQEPPTMPYRTTENTDAATLVALALAFRDHLERGLTLESA